MEIDITAENFNKEVVESDKLFLLDCFTKWCMPCKMMSPVITEIAEENAEINVGKVDLEKNPEVASQLGITGVPTFVFFKQGKEQNRKVGAIQKVALEKYITELI